MAYPTITAGDAGKYLTAKRAGAAVDVDSLIRIKGLGDAMDQSFAATLRGELDALRATFPEGVASSAKANLFEAKAARITHRLVPSDPEALSDPEFWIWLAVAHCPETVEWRYRSADGAGFAPPINYGVGARENFIYRSWMRADLLIEDHLPDPYALSDSGQIDFYRSHLFRQGYAAARPFSRALIRYQYPNKDRTSPRLKTLEIRDLVKRLKRLRSNLFLEILSEEHCRQVIEMEASNLLAA